jgi:hypothetical protein
MTVIWAIAPWGLVETDRRFGAAHCRRHQGDPVLPDCRRATNGYSCSVDKFRIFFIQSLHNLRQTASVEDHCKSISQGIKVTAANQNWGSKWGDIYHVAIL